MSSKYSPKEKISRKLEQSIEEHLSSLAVSDILMGVLDPRISFAKKEGAR